jgi:hypothetical protein
MAIVPIKNATKKPRYKGIANIREIKILRIISPKEKKQKEKQSLFLKCFKSFIQ